MPMKEFLIRKQACFSQLTDQEIQELAGLLTEKNYPSGSTIVVEGDPVDSVYLIVSGTADVIHQFIREDDDSIQSQLLATLGPETAIGLNETGLYSLSGKRTATVVAASDMVLLHLSVARYRGFELSHTHVKDVMRKHSEDLS